MSSFPTPEGLLRFRAPRTSWAAFTDTLNSRYGDARELRTHMVIGANSRRVLLLHGWPHAWYASRMLIPARAWDLEVVAIDPRESRCPPSPPTGSTRHPHRGTWSH